LDGLWLGVACADGGQKLFEGLLACVVQEAVDGHFYQLQVMRGEIVAVVCGGDDF
jgi:hypothetical protein